MAEYTPSDDEVRRVWSVAPVDLAGCWHKNPAPEYAGEQFDRWLAAHDARVRRDAARSALDGLAENMRRISTAADEPLLRIQAAFAADIAAEYKATAYPETEDQT